MANYLRRVGLVAGGGRFAVEFASSLITCVFCTVEFHRVKIVKAQLLGKLARNKTTLTLKLTV